MTEHALPTIFHRIAVRLGLMRRPEPRWVPVVTVNGVEHKGRFVVGGGVTYTGEEGL